MDPEKIARGLRDLADRCVREAMDLAAESRRDLTPDDLTEARILHAAARLIRDAYLEDQAAPARPAAWTQAGTTVAAIRALADYVRGRGREERLEALAANYAFRTSDQSESHPVRKILNHAALELAKLEP